MKMTTKVEKLIADTKTALAYGDKITTVALDKSTGATVDNFCVAGITRHGPFINIPQFWNVADITKVGNVLLVTYEQVERPRPTIANQVVHGLGLFDGKEDHSFADIKRAAAAVIANPQWQICCSLAAEQQSYVGLVGIGRVHRTFKGDCMSFLYNGQRLCDVDMSYELEVPRIKDVVNQSKEDPYWDDFCYSEIFVDRLIVQGIQITADCPPSWQRAARLWAEKNSWQFVKLAKRANL